MSANNLTNPPSTPNETTVAAMQEARQMSAKSTKNKKESTLAKLKKGEMAQQKLHDMRVAFDEGFAIIREVGVMPSSLLTELASVFHSNSVEPRYINSELVKNDIKLYKAEKEFNATHAKRLKEALSENAHLKSQLEQMKQMTGMSGCPTPMYGFYNGSPILDPNSPKMPFSDNGSINNYGFQNLFAPPNSFPGRYPASPFPGNQPVHPGELLQRIMNLEAEVTKLQQRHISAQFQPQPQQFQSQFQVPPMPSQPLPAQMPYNAHKSVGTPSMQTLQEEGANKIYAFVQQKLIKEEKFTLNDLFQAIGPGFQWSRYVPEHSFPTEWLSDVLRNAPANAGFVFKPAMRFADAIIERRTASVNTSNTPLFTQEEERIASYIYELLLRETYPQYVTIRELIDHMNKRGYVWDTKGLGIMSVDAWMLEKCEKLIGRLGFMLEKANRMDESCIVGFQPEVSKNLLICVSNSMKAHTDFHQWTTKRLIANLSTYSGIFPTVVACYLRYWQSRGIVSVREGDMFLDYAKCLTFDYDKVKQAIEG